MPSRLSLYRKAAATSTRDSKAGCTTTFVSTARRLADDRNAEPMAAIIDSRTLRSTPVSGERAGYDGGKRKKGSKIHIAVNTLGHLLALHVTPGSVEDRGEVERLARTVQAVASDTVELGWVDQGYTGKRTANAAAKHGIALEVVKRSEAKRDFVLLPRRWVVERSCAWATGFRRLVKVYERYAETLAGLHIVAFACLMRSRPSHPPQVHNSLWVW